MKLEHLKIARNWLKEAGELDGYCFNSFLVVWDNNTILTNDNAACYGRLIDCTYYNHTPIAILNRKQANDFSEEINKAYFSWLMNDSPYAKCFSSKKYSTIERYGVMVVDTDSPTNLMIGGLIASRQLNEHPHIGRAWWELINRGVHPNMAYVIGHYLWIAKDKLALSPTKSHTSLEFNNSTVESFWLNKPTSVGKPYSKVRSYGGISNVWNNYQSTIDWGKLIGEAVKNSGKTEVTNNPFKQAEKDRGGYYDKEKALDNVAEAIHNVLNEGRLVA